VRKEFLPEYQRRIRHKSSSPLWDGNPPLLFPFHARGAWRSRHRKTLISILRLQSTCRREKYEKNVHLAIATCSPPHCRRTGGGCGPKRFLHSRLCASVRVGVCILVRAASFDAGFLYPEELAIAAEWKNIVLSPRREHPFCGMPIIAAEFIAEYIVLSSRRKHGFA